MKELLDGLNVRSKKSNEIMRELKLFRDMILDVLGTGEEIEINHKEKEFILLISETGSKIDCKKQKPSESHYDHERLIAAIRVIFGDPLMGEKFCDNLLLQLRSNKIDISIEELYKMLSDFEIGSQ